MSTIPPTPVLIVSAGVLLIASFYALRPRFSSTRQEAWIFSTIASLVMTLANIPFLYDYLSNRGSLMHVHSHPHISIPVARFSQSYLALDLILGLVHYRSHLGFSTWLHHILRISLVEVVVRRSWLPIFFLCACMEAPTFLRGLSALHPPSPTTKTNTAFFSILTFLITRILFPIIIGFASIREPTRRLRFSGSYIPGGLILALVVPFHIIWFCYRLRRMHRLFFQSGKVGQSVETVIKLEIFAADRTSGTQDMATAKKQHQRRISSEGVGDVASTTAFPTAPSMLPPPPPSTLVHLPQSTSSPHPASSTLAVSAHKTTSKPYFYLHDIPSTTATLTSRPTSTAHGTFSAKVRSAIPRQTREALYECVGLGRRPRVPGSAEGARRSRRCMGTNMGIGMGMNGHVGGGRTVVIQ